MDCETLWQIFTGENLTFFTGVPDSTFKAWMVFLDRTQDSKLTNIIASNECEAIAIATGYHLATNKLGVVYLQNTGEGKTVNPLTSLCDPEVYSIPMLLLIGWRGRPGEKDEPQHKKMGKITPSLLELLGIPYEILSNNPDDSKQLIKSIIKKSKEQQRPVAIIVPRGVIDDPLYKQSFDPQYTLNREDTIKIIMQNLSGSEVIISTTGKTSRELFEYRIDRNETPQDFYTVGGMGCAPAIAFGAALQQPSKRFIVLDGDGSLLMQMGSLATIGYYKPTNFIHILFDNESHESTGGQPTVSSNVSFPGIAQACGYATVNEVSSQENVQEVLKKILQRKGPHFLSIKINQGSRPDLGRPTTSPIQNKKEFMKFLRS
jgi:phosphonopyruvate decarboxylase